MTKHVILLTDAHEAPATTLVEILHGAGVTLLIEGLREAEIEARLIQGRERDSAGASAQATPLAIIYEVASGTDVVDIHAAVEHANMVWPGAPLVACRRSDERSRFGLRPLGGAALKRIGFHFVADNPTQLPALLREVEEGGATFDAPSSESIDDALASVTLLPARLKMKSLRACFELVASLHFATDQKSAARTALAGLGALMRADRWAIYLASEASGAPEGAGLEPLAVRGLTESEREISEDDWRRTLLGDTAALIGSESKASREAARSAETVKKKEGARRVLAVPMMGGERVLGIIEGVREGERARSFTRYEVSLLNALALPIASALANSVRIAEAERLSQTDDLTKLHNARYLRQFLLNEIKRARRYGSSVAAIFLDLDDFKRINDLHGHLVGSHLLMEMAAVILSSVRDTDAVARYGGDEFVVVLPETSKKMAAEVAERIRGSVEKAGIEGDRQAASGHFTASLGIASFPEDATEEGELIRKADLALYHAKTCGRNRVSGYDEAKA